MQGVGNSFGQSVNIVKNLVKSNILSPITQAWSDFVSVGGNLVKGIWQGISNGTSWIKTKIKQWVGDVVKFIKGLFGIKSPSTLMENEVGKNVGAGVATGMVKGYVARIPGIKKSMLLPQAQSVNVNATSTTQAPVINQTWNISGEITQRKTQQFAAGVMREALYGY